MDGKNPPRELVFDKAAVAAIVTIEQLEAVIRQASLDLEALDQEDTPC